MLKFAIRDDDISYFTEPDKINEIYKDISDICPISFSCIPFIGGHSVDLSDPEEISKYDKAWLSWLTDEIKPIDGNKKLIDFLIDWAEKGRCTIMMHGIHHELYEFDHNKDYYQALIESKHYMEKLFKRNISIFTPPNNSISKQAIYAIEKCKFNLLISFGHRLSERPFRIDNIFNFMKLLVMVAKFNKKRRTLKPLMFKNHIEQGCYDLGPNTNFNEVHEGLVYAANNNANFVMATHHYHMYENKEIKNQIMELINSAIRITDNKVKFVCAEEIFLGDV